MPPGTPSVCYDLLMGRDVRVGVVVFAMVSRRDDIMPILSDSSDHVMSVRWACAAVMINMLGDVMTYNRKMIGSLTCFDHSGIYRIWDFSIDF